MSCISKIVLGQGAGRPASGPQSQTNGKSVVRDHLEVQTPGVQLIPTQKDEKKHRGSSNKDLCPRANVVVQTNTTPVLNVYLFLLPTQLRFGFSVSQKHKSHV